MARFILGDGLYPSDLMLVGERPGKEEAQQGRPFVGPAGQELWARLLRTTKLERLDFYITNLVKTFSPKPPTADEIRRDQLLLRAEILKVKPKFILAVGAHAARWFLPQFVGVKQDFFHGLAFSYTYGTLHPRTALVVPCVHPSAALRQPALYQNALTEDLAAFGRVARGEQTAHEVQIVRPYRIGLAAFGKEGLHLGVDTEGWTDDPQAISLCGAGLLDTLTWPPRAGRSVEACLIELGVTPSKFVAPALHHAARLSIWHLKHDLQVLARAGIDLLTSDVQLDDPMAMAYVLGLPQALKVFAFRHLHITMREYDDLVAPLDADRVRSTLEDHYVRFTKSFGQRARGEARIKARYRNLKNRTRAKGKAAAAVAALPTPRTPNGEEIPKRALSAIRRYIGGASKGESQAQAVAAGAGASETPLRKRWQKSRFSRLITLPPPVTWKDVPEADRVPYALTDAIAHKWATEYMQPLLKAKRLQRVYAIDRAIIPFLARSEMQGLACDGDQLRQLSAEFLAEYDEKCEGLSRIAGRAVNPMASESVSDLLFDQLKVPPTRVLKSGYYTTQDKYLKARKKAHPAVQLVIDARQLNKYRGTYTERLPKLLRRGADGIERYFPDWKYTRTASGRAAESIILLIPKHSERGKRIRNCFHATDGHTLVSCDLSQIEMRVMAHESHDKLFVQAYEQGIDMHAQTAHHLLGAPKRKEDQDESLHRLPAKTLNFGILMGMTEYGLADQLQEQGQLQWIVELTTELRRQGFKSTREFRDEWFKVYKGVARWCEEKKAEARHRGYVTDLAGRRRYLSAIWSDDPRIQAEAERQAHATPIQAGAQIVAKLWIARIWKRIIVPYLQSGRRYCEPWVWIHDDVTLEVDARIAKQVRARMLQLVPDILDVPTSADGKLGERWGSLH